MIYVGASSSVFKSADGGRTWSRHDLPERFADNAVVLFGIDRLAIDPDNTNTIYAVVRDAGSGSGIFKSADGGIMWQLVFRSRDGSVWDFDVAPHLSQILYTVTYTFTQEAGFHFSILRSLDGGVTWEELPSPPRQSSSLTIAPQHPTTVYAATTGGVYSFTVPSGSDLVVAPPDLNFQEVGLGQQRELVLTVRNEGLADLHIERITVTGEGFTVPGMPPEGFTISALASREIRVAFVPVREGTVVGRLTITTDNPEEGPVDVVLVGKGVKEALVVRWDTPGEARDVVVDGGVAYVADGMGGACASSMSQIRRIPRRPGPGGRPGSARRLWRSEEGSPMCGGLRASSWPMSRRNIPRARSVQ
jgi:hypothetical protein